MLMRAPLLVMALAVLATACSEDAPLPPLEENPPPFEFSLYLEKGRLKPKADVLLVRCPKHLEHVYELALKEETEPGQAQAQQLFGEIEGQFIAAGTFVANQAASLRCTAVELPDCIPKWGFI
jgi:hypothetical protein